MIGNKHIAAIGGGILVVVVLIIATHQGVFVSDTVVDVSERGASQDTHPESGHQVYRINTDCELIYGLSYGVYPSDERLPEFRITDLVEKYPQEFAPWKDIMEDAVKRDDFFSRPLPGDFGEILVVAMMKETSINPGLKDTAMIIADPQGRLKLAEEYEEHGCGPYFESREKK